MPKRNCESYKALISFIKKKLEKREEWQKRITKANDDGAKEVYGIRFTIFADTDTRERFIAELMKQIEGVNNFLDQVAGRNDGRHQELVSLVVEQFELEVETAKERKHAGGFLHQQKCNERLEEIKVRIGEIINA